MARKMVSVKKKIPATKKIPARKQGPVKKQVRVKKIAPVKKEMPVKMRGAARKEGTVKKYVVRLSEEERAELLDLIRAGRRAARVLMKARILLKADVSDAGPGWSDSKIVAALKTSIRTVERTRRDLVEGGFERALYHQYNQSSAPRRIFDGEAEAKLIALSSGPAPEGYPKWTLRLLEEKVVELEIVEKASDNTIGRTLKKTF